MPSDADARKPFTMPNGSALSLASLPRGGLAHRRERWSGEHLPDERDAQLCGDEHTEISRAILGALLGEPQPF